MSASPTVSDLKQPGTVTKEELSQFYRSCQSFLIEAVSQIQKRYSLNDKIHEVVACIYPRSASTLNPPSLAYLFDELPQLAKYANTNLVDEEWMTNFLINSTSQSTGILC